MATGKWIIAEDIRECGCLMTAYVNEDDTTRIDMLDIHYCPRHKAALELYEALRFAIMALSNLAKHDGDSPMNWAKRLKNAEKALALADGDV